MNGEFPPDSQCEAPPDEPQVIDWWVWSVRQAASLVGSMLLALRGIVLLYVLFRVGVWYVTREPVAPREVGIAVAALLAAWGLGPLLARFAISRDSPIPRVGIVCGEDSDHMARHSICNGSPSCEESRECGRSEKTFWRVRT